MHSFRKTSTSARSTGRSGRHSGPRTGVDSLHRTGRRTRRRARGGRQASTELHGGREEEAEQGEGQLRRSLCAQQEPRGDERQRRRSSRRRPGRRGHGAADEPPQERRVRGGDGVQQRPGVQGQVRLRGQLRGLHGLRPEQPRDPEQVAQVVCPGSQNDVSVYKRRAGALDGLEPQQQHLHQHRAAGHREELVGGHEGLRHQRPDRTRSTSPRWRPRVDRTRTPSRRARAARTCGSTCRRTSRAPRSRTASRRTT